MDFENCCSHLADNQNTPKKDPYALSAVNCRRLGIPQQLTTAECIIC